ncbi:MAG: hypothetical protein K2O16_02765 [Lachnospiraceae bacterium]|nr:hypothetical protein [Lachnospiraceae bacterium]
MKQRPPLHVPRGNTVGEADRICSADEGAWRGGSGTGNSVRPSMCPEEILSAKQTGFALPMKVHGGEEAELE